MLTYLFDVEQDICQFNPCNFFDSMTGENPLYISPIVDFYAQTNGTFE